MIYFLEPIMFGTSLKVYRDKQTYIINNFKSIQFLEQWCLNNGASLQGRRAACAYFMQITQKIPILVSEVSKDIVFPLAAVGTNTCIWLNYRSIISVKRDNKKTKVCFLNGFEKTFAVDIRSIRRELNICEAYLKVLQKLK